MLVFTCDRCTKPIHQALAFYHCFEASCFITIQTLQGFTSISKFFPNAAKRPLLKFSRPLDLKQQQQLYQDYNYNKITTVSLPSDTDKLTLIRTAYSSPLTCLAEMENSHILVNWNTCEIEELISTADLGRDGTKCLA